MLEVLHFGGSLDRKHRWLETIRIPKMEVLVLQHKSHKVNFKSYYWHQRWIFSHTLEDSLLIRHFHHSLLTENEASIAVLSSIQTGYGNSIRTGKYCRAQEFYKDEETNILSGGMSKLCIKQKQFSYIVIILYYNRKFAKMFYLIYLALYQE